VYPGQRLDGAPLNASAIVEGSLGKQDLGLLLQTAVKDEREVASSSHNLPLPDTEPRALCCDCPASEEGV